MFHTCLNRITDWRRERRIRRLHRQATGALLDGHKSLALSLFHDLAAEVAARSPQQVARMETHRGLR